MIGEISGAEEEEENDGYCYEWSLLEARVAENMEAEILEEPYEALEEGLQAATVAAPLQALLTTAEDQWKHQMQYTHMWEALREAGASDAKEKKPK